MNGHAPNVGVSAAHRAAHEQLTEAVSALRTAEPGDYAEVLDDAAYKIGALVGHGFLDRSDAADALTGACVANGFTAEAGPDLVQEAISAGFVAGGLAAKADIAAAERTPVALPATPRLPVDIDDIKSWPVMQSHAKHGLLGDIATLATAHSEADPVAVKATFLAAAGALFGRHRFINIGDDAHHPRLYAALVGTSSLARKGTSYGSVRRIMKATELALQKESTLPFPSGAPLKVSHGPLSTGEGLIAAIRDKRGDDDDGEVKDKRLFCIESELGAALRACQRQGNTLSSVLRAAWDGWPLEPLIKTDRTRATDPHICLVAHVTREELAQLLSSSDIWNGFANRFLWLAVRRAKTVPFPKGMSDVDVDRIATELAKVIKYAHGRSDNDRRMVMSNSAQSFYVDCYPELTQEHTGILGAVTGRAAAQTQRLALTYALLDGADRIEIEHVEAGLTFWRYCFDSARYIFKGAEIDPVAQAIVTALVSGPKTQTEVSGLFDRHLPKERLSAVLTDLQERGKITLRLEKTGGAPRKIWSLGQ
jgi:hypothetical protein